MLAACTTSERHYVTARPFTHFFLVTRPQDKETESSNKLGYFVIALCILKKSKFDGKNIRVVGLRGDMCAVAEACLVPWPLEGVVGTLSWILP